MDMYAYIYICTVTDISIISTDILICMQVGTYTYLHTICVYKYDSCNLYVLA